MSVTVSGDIVHLTGACLVEDAEPLLLAFHANPACTVDVSGAVRLHMAVAQLLLAARPKVSGVPSDVFLRDHLFAKLR